MYKKARRLFAASAAVALLLSGCSSTPTADAPPADNIHYPLNATFPSLDPMMSTSNAAGIPGHHIWETLVAFDDNFVPQPELAESWEFNADATEVTFKLRQGVTFHTGQEMTADDVVASLNRWAGLAARGKAMMEGQQFVAADKYTVKANFTKPHADVLAQLANPLQFAAIMPASVIAAAQPSGVTEFVGTGPYKYVDYKTDQSVHLTKYDGYKPLPGEPKAFSGEKTAPTKDLYFDVVTDGSTRLSSFLSGQSNFTDVSPDNFAQVENQEGVVTQKVLATSQILVFNMKSPIFSDQKAREAVNAGIKPEEILLGVASSPDLYRLNSSYAFTENTEWHSEAGSEAYNKPDESKAKDLLGESTYNGQTVRILTSHDLGGVFYKPAVVLQSQLEALGMKVQLDVSDYATLISKRNNPETWDIYIGAFLVPSTPSQLIYFGPNYGHNSDPEIPKLVGATAAAQTEAEKREATDALQSYVWKTLPVINIGDTYNYHAVRNGVKNYENFANWPILWNAAAPAQ